MAKLTANMVDVLTNAHYSEHDAKREGMTGWVVTGQNIDGRTRKAMHTRGLLHGCYYLTPEGVEERTRLMGEMLSDMIAEEITGAPVEIAGDDPMDWAPDFSAPTSRECFFGHGFDVVAVTVDMYGVSQGLCANCVDRVERSYPFPVNAPENATQDVVVDEPMVPTVAVIQDTPGMSGLTHYHTPGCRDIAREQKRYGQSKGDALRMEFHNVAEILVFEFGDIASDDHEWGTRDWWVSVIENANDGVKIMPCLADKIVNGLVDNGDPLIIAGNLFRIGFKAPEIRTDYVCPGNEAECTYLPCTRCADEIIQELTEDDDTDAGFMETDDSEEIIANVLDIARKEWLTNSVVRTKMHVENFWHGRVTDHTVREENGIFIPCAIVTDRKGNSRTIDTNSLEFDTSAKPVSTGTTHHTMDTDGKRWERFEHVLSEGDMVKISKNRGYGVVHCTIPGLPVVYVDMGTGEEPMPYPALDVIAL